MKIKLLRCPSCGSDDVITTLKGCAPGHDSNRVSCCQCSEVGVAQDWIDLEEKLVGMVPENKPDDVMTLDLINEAVKKAKLVGINGPLSMYVWPDTPWTCTLCGHVQPISKTTCQGCGEEARAKLR